MKAPAAKAAVLRCAVYTRKSSEEGLEQSFNSLHAQREACEAYVKSQVGEGWVLIDTPYDDGGFSGGSMDRPALKALLTDIDAGLIDVVVVYKVDRLTRSLTDFARIVDTFDRVGASFVSVTQAFNTTSSMGRLTLNVLLSFAQFEREVTGERIRDKIAQSKAKGMWMGGNLPLGYDAGDHVLIVNEAEARQVRQIFQRYLKLGSVHGLCDELRRKGQRSKAWTSSRGKAMGGAQFSRGALFHLLQNRHYLGEIRHKQITHPGLHAGIVDPRLFEAVQRRLGANRVKREARAGDRSIAPLTGLIFDGQGRRLTPTFSYGRAGRCYRYYVPSDAQCGGAKARSDDGSPARLPAEALEGAVLAHLRRLSSRPDGQWTVMVRALLRLEVRPDSLQLLLDPGALFGEDHPELAFQDLEARLAPGERVVRESGEVASIRVAIPGRLQFRGGRTWRIDSARRSPVDPALVDALKSAHLTLAGCGCAPSQALNSWDPIRAPAAAHVLKRSGLALLSPALQAAILAGRAPRSLTLQRLLAADIPLAWADQDAMFGPDDLAG